MRIPFLVGASYRSESVVAATERTMNWIPEIIEAEGGKAQIVLYPTPGLGVPKVTFAAGSGRGIFETQGRVFTVQGTSLWEIDQNYNPTLRGSIQLDGNPVTMSGNGDGGDELFVTSGNEGYVLDMLTNTLTNPVSDVTMGDHLDGFFVALDATTSTLKISDSLDGNTWDPLQFVQRSDASDPWKAMISQGGEIWTIGSKTGGVFYNAGTAPFPFQLRTEAFFERGIIAPFSLALFDNSIAWLGSSQQGFGIVYRAQGYQPVRISNHAIEQAIDGYAVQSDAVGWSYEDRGHTFYVLDFPTAQRTWVYDASTQMWHERAKWDASLGQYRSYRARHHCLGFETRHLVTDPVDGAIYELDRNVFTDAGGDVLRRERVTAHTSSEHRQIVVDEVQIELERGVGLVSGQGSDPLIMFDFSRDGGRTWSNQRTVSAGRLGRYRARAKFYRLGLGRDWVFRIAVSDPVAWRIIDGYFLAREGAH